MSPRPPLPLEDRLLTPAEVGVKFGTDARTVTRWDEQGLFAEGTVVRTLGGHRRFKEAEINRLLRANHYRPVTVQEDGAA